MTKVVVQVNRSAHTGTQQQVAACAAVAALRWPPMLKSAMTLRFSIGLLVVLLPSLAPAAVPEGRWIKLPTACGDRGDKHCGGDEISINGNFLRWQNCKRAAFRVVSDTGTTAILKVLDTTPCYWHKQKVVVFKLKAQGARLSLYGYKAMPADEHTELFQGHGFAKD